MNRQQRRAAVAASAAIDKGVAVPMVLLNRESPVMPKLAGRLMAIAYEETMGLSDEGRSDHIAMACFSLMCAFIAKFDDDVHRNAVMAEIPAMLTAMVARNRMLAGEVETMRADADEQAEEGGESFEDFMRKMAKEVGTVVEANPKRVEN